MPRLLLVVVLAVWLGGCAPQGGDGRPTVLVSVPPQAYLVERLAGEAVDVEVMIPPGASPHTYEPSVEQMKAVARASVYLTIAHPQFAFEEVWLERLLENNPRLKAVPVTKGIPVQPDDPHLWVSPRALKVMARNTAEALEGLVPAQKLETLEAELDALDKQLSAELGPLRGTSFYVFHPAWGYLARDYGLTQVPIEQGHRDPSAAELSELIHQAREAGARVIFVQPQFSRQGADVLAREVGARVEVADPLSSDPLEAARAFARKLLP